MTIIIGWEEGSWLSLLQSVMFTFSWYYS